jgi:hypothetical protein
MTKSKSAFLFSSGKLGTERLFLWTFTFKELLGVKDTRKRWNRLLTAMKRTWPELQGIRVFEMHKRHRCCWEFAVSMEVGKHERVISISCLSLSTIMDWTMLSTICLFSSVESSGQRF